MITKLERSILYFCPDCSAVSTKKISAFGISGQNPHTKYCSNAVCSKALIEFSYKKNKYHICVDCPVCGDKHSFNLTQKTMWGKDFFILNCPASGLGILFIGKDEKRLMEEYYAQTELIAGIIADGDEEFEKLDILFEIVEILNELAQDKAINCSCGSDKISINLNGEDVELLCRKCGTRTKIPSTVQALDMLEDIDTFTLE